MTPDMILRARANAKEANLDHVEFHEGRIDQIPLADDIADCIISNCVINLAPDKNLVFKEMFRILKPGGRISVSDIALKQPLPESLASNVMAYVGCIAGAISIDDFERGLRHAGFEAVHVVDSKADLNAYTLVDGQSACCPPPKEKLSLTVKDQSCCGTSCCDSSTEAENVDVHDGLKSVMAQYNINEYAASVKVYAIKPKLILD